MFVWSSNIASKEQSSLSLSSLSSEVSFDKFDGLFLQKSLQWLKTEVYDI